MGKAEFLTPKAIANRIKAKGLQKLRWYCQLCHKQCRDENGFKCHSESEGHQRQLSLFASRPGKFLDSFSEEFEKTFVDELKRRFGSKRVHANLVYNEYIHDRHHTHMNSTIWTTLTGFVKHLGKTGKCIVDETPKGWYISYINRDPEVIARQEAIAKKEKMDVDDEERNRRMIQKRLEELAKLGVDVPSDESDQQGSGAGEGGDAENDDSQVPHTVVKFSLSRPGVKTEVIETPTPSAEGPTTTSSSDTTPSVKQEPSEDDEATRESTPSVPTPSPSSSSSGVKMNVKPINPFDLAAKSAAKDTKEKEANENDKKRKRPTTEKTMMEKIMEAEERDKEKKNRKDFWVTPGVVVKLMNKTLADGKYYKVKGVVLEVIDRYVAQIKVIDLGDVLKLDQSQLETVIPQIGGKVKVVNGAYRGETAVLQGLDVDNFSAKIKLTSGPNSSKVLPAVPYEDICKTHAQ